MVNREGMTGLAGGPGFEPGLSGSEPEVLPLNYPPWMTVQLASPLVAGKIDLIFPASPLIKMFIHDWAANGACPAPQHLANIRVDGERPNPSD